MKETDKNLPRTPYKRGSLAEIPRPSAKTRPRNGSLEWLVKYPREAERAQAVQIRTVEDLRDGLTRLEGFLLISVFVDDFKEGFIKITGFLMNYGEAFHEFRGCYRGLCEIVGVV